MDIFVRNELEALKGEIEAKNYALEADKYSFIHQLESGMGERMLQELRNPPKPDKKLARKLIAARKKKEKEEKKLLDKLNKEKRDL